MITRGVATRSPAHAYLVKNKNSRAQLKQRAISKSAIHLHPHNSGRFGNLKIDLFQLGNFITHGACFFEFQIARMLIHTGFQLLQLLRELLGRQPGVVASVAADLVPTAAPLARSRAADVHDVGNPFDDALRRNIVLQVVGYLDVATAGGFGNRISF